MNYNEREKVTALVKLHIPDFGHSAKLIKNLLWRLDHNAGAPLSPKEKYLLDLACWHYRNRLGGLVMFDLPKAQPVLSSYQRSESSTVGQVRLL
ncbi:MAG: hypothetical protein ABTR07_15270 [Candidatus Competibacter denitrificans]